MSAINNNYPNINTLFIRDGQATPKKICRFALNLLWDQIDLQAEQQETYKFRVLEGKQQQLLCITVTKNDEGGASVSSLSRASDTELEGLPLITIKTAKEQLETLITQYFTKPKKGEYHLSLNDPVLSGRIKSALETLPKALRYSDTIVFAKDLNTNTLMAAPTQRLWMPPEECSQLWEGGKNGWEEALADQKVTFASISADTFTIQLLTKAVSTYAKHSKVLNPHFVQGLFALKLANRISYRSSYDERLTFVNTLKSYFPDALHSEQWNKLYAMLHQTDITKDLQDLMKSHKPTVESLAAMAVSNLNGGELKIALDYCRNPEKTSPTLASQLQFLAFNEKEGIREIPVCKSCIQIWPALEAVYWALKESGLKI